MKSKAPLVLMEQLVMVLVFALAAALCVQAFVKADLDSRHMEARDNALREAQNAAETLKSLSGDFEAASAQYGGAWDGTEWIIAYSDEWTQSTPSADGESTSYVLRVYPSDSGQLYLRTAEITVSSGDDELCKFTVAWQEPRNTFIKGTADRAAASSAADGTQLLDAAETPSEASWTGTASFPGSEDLCVLPLAPKEATP